MSPGGGASLVPQATGRHLTGPPAPEAEEWAPVQETGMTSLKHGAPNTCYQPSLAQRDSRRVS